MPEPEVRDHDVLVAIHAASLNPLDAKIRDGEFKLILPYRLPLILGRVRGFKPGDEVYARPHQDRIRTLAELIAMNEADVRANGGQLRITSLIESGVIRQVVTRIFPFEATNEAMACLATGRAKGKIVIKVS